MPSPSPIRRHLPLVLWLALGVAFFGSLLTAAHFYPTKYLWHYDVMSRLAEPRFNPHAYLLACLGLALGGVLLFFFPAMLRPRLAAVAPLTARISGILLYLAAGFLSLSGIVPGHIPALGRAHETLAQIYGGFISLATIGYCFAALRLPRKFALHRFAGIFLILIPFTGFMISRIYLFTHGGPTNSAAFHALKQNAWISLAFWEWTAATGTYLLLGLLLTLPESKKIP